MDRYWLPTNDIIHEETPEVYSAPTRYFIPNKIPLSAPDVVCNIFRVPSRRLLAKHAQSIAAKQRLLIAIECRGDVVA